MNPMEPYPGYIPYDQRDFQLGPLPSIFHSYFLTLIAELGDKTFIMLIILQLRTNKLTILLSSLFALLGMNFFAILIGYSIDFLLYKNFIDYLGLLFFLIYGCWLIGESLHTAENSFENELNQINSEQQQQKEQQEKEMKKLSSQQALYQELTIIPELTREYSKGLDDQTTTPLLESDNSRNMFIFGKKRQSEDNEILNNDKFPTDEVEPKMFWIIASTMALSECGDRTQFSGMTMSAVFDFTGVLIGSCCALITTVSLGVFLGKFLSKYLKEKILNFILGFIFLGYAVEIYIGKNYSQKPLFVH